MTALALAQEMFTAYNAQGPNPWKTHDGRDVPRWEALGDQVQGKWIAAALRAIELTDTTEDVTPDQRPMPR